MRRASVYALGRKSRCLASAVLTPGRQPIPQMVRACASTATPQERGACECACGVDSCLWVALARADAPCARPLVRLHGQISRVLCCSHGRRSLTHPFECMRPMAERFSESRGRFQQRSRTRSGASNAPTERIALSRASQSRFVTQSRLKPTQCCSTALAGRLDSSGPVLVAVSRCAFRRLDHSIGTPARPSP